MNYRCQICFKKGKFLGYSYLNMMKVIPVIDIEVSYFHKEGTETIKAGTVLRIEYSNGVYELSCLYPNLRRYAVSEEILNKYFVISNISFLNEEDKGLKIYKGLKLVYKSQNSGLHKTREYVQSIDVPLKRMLLFNPALTKCFMGKTLKVVSELQKTVKIASKIEIENCLKSVNEYLMTTINTMEELSKTTDLSNHISVKQLMQKTKAQEFLEDMKYRNQVAKEFLQA